MARWPAYILSFGLAACAAVVAMLQVIGAWLPQAAEDGVGQRFTLALSVVPALAATVVFALIYGLLRRGRGRPGALWGQGAVFALVLGTAFSLATLWGYVTPTEGGVALLGLGFVGGAVLTGRWERAGQGEAP